ncbi:uncharacterized protein [Palaemon carinicauda]|uniref:uncharacterized protein n=1 Tax=Palaemon carinicauda TaxID=392227 RepID=UPI0035B64198
MKFQPSLRPSVKYSSNHGNQFSKVYVDKFNRYSGSSTGTVPKQNVIVPQQQSSNHPPSNIVKNVQKTAKTKKQSVKVKEENKPANVYMTNRTNPNSVDTFKPYIYEGMLAAMDESERTPFMILRDTGCNHIVVVRRVLLLVEHSLTGDLVILKGIGGEEVTHICRLKLSCEFLTGNFDFAVKDSSVVEGVDILLGNEVGGTPFVPCPIVTEKPLKYSPTTKLEMDYLYLFPSCVTTRGITKKVAAEEEKELNDELGGLVFRRRGFP